MKISRQKGNRNKFGDEKKNYYDDDGNMFTTIDGD